MFTVRFRTRRYRPDLVVTVRNSVDGWDHDVVGRFVAGAWEFVFDEARYGAQIQFKFVLERQRWMLGGDQVRLAVDGAQYDFDDSGVRFETPREPFTESGIVPQLFFSTEGGERSFDAIVIGSGLGGGILADQLSDLGADVLVLEAGSYLFPVHVANLPRQHKVGRFDKHVWDLWDEFRVVSHDNAPGAEYRGAQGFNLGGRSLFWGGVIPRMRWWELEAWPTPIRWYLEGSGYQRAEDLMNRVPVTPSPYHQRIKSELRSLLPEFDLFDCPLALQATTLDRGMIPAGMFSTADLLLESVLTEDEAGSRHLNVNLNHRVLRLETQGHQVTGVVARDLIADVERLFRGRTVVLAAGAVESARLALVSGLSDPNGRVGRGITDHPIYYVHFAVPASAASYDGNGASKLLLQHRAATAAEHSYNVVLELGADLNQGRYVDADILRRHRQIRGEHMLCEFVALVSAPLEDTHTVTLGPNPERRALISMRRSSAGALFEREIDALKTTLLSHLGGEPLAGESLDLQVADVGGVAHEVGTLRLAEDGSGVVDTDLRFLGYDNLYVSDLSVFPCSPAANPSLTLAALAIRLAEHIRSRLD